MLIKKNLVGREKYIICDTMRTEVRNRVSSASHMSQGLVVGQKLAAFELAVVHFMKGTFGPD